MKNIIYFSIFSASYFFGCQDSSLKLNPIVIDSENKFEIKDENKILGESNDTVRANLIVNDHDLRRIWLTKNYKNKDTLFIEIHRSDEVYDHSYIIRIINGKCSVKYQYEMSGPILERSIIPVDYLVKLNSMNFIKGQEIRGYTEFRGKCIGEGCYQEADVVIKGNFKVVIN